MSMFRYFKEGASVEEKGQILRVLSTNAQPYLSATLEDGETSKYTETDFQEWWDEAVSTDTKTAALEAATESGTFFDDQYGILSLLDGEPTSNVEDGLGDV